MTLGWLEYLFPAIVRPASPVSSSCAISDIETNSEGESSERAPEVNDREFPELVWWPRFLPRQQFVSVPRPRE